MTAGGSLRDWTSMTWFSYGWPGPFLEVGQYSKAPKDLYSTNTPLSLLSLENAGFRWFCECGIAAEDAIVSIYDRGVFFQAVGRGFDPRLPLHHLKGLSPRPKAHRAYDSTTGCLFGVSFRAFSSPCVLQPDQADGTRSRVHQPWVRRTEHEWQD